MGRDSDRIFLHIGVMHHPLTRRILVSRLALGAAAFMLARRSRAADAPKLETTAPAAAALGYVEDATKVDGRKYPAYAIGSACDNCLQLQGHVGDAYRPCTVFPGKLVAAKGWCSSWTPEM